MRLLTSNTAMKACALIKLTFALWLTYLITGCSSIEQSNEQDNASLIMELTTVPKALQNRVWLEKFDFTLAAAKHNIALQQLTSEALLMQTELSSTGITLAAMSFDGVPIAQAMWQQGSQEVATEMALTQYFNGKQVIHDLQAANWPASALKPVLLPGISLDEKMVADVKTRRFYQNNQVIILIRYQSSEQGQLITFEQKAAGYTLAITRLSDTLVATE